MGFLADYVYYSSGNECPEDYLYWGGLSILGHLLGGKVAIAHGDYFPFRPNIYVCLVGEPGSGKNTCLGVNMDIMSEHFSQYLVSASIQSREDIAFQMADDVTCLKTYKDELGINCDYRPFYVLNNELASFLSVDKLKMVEFLTEVYDGKRFGTGFKKDRQTAPTRQQWFRNPHLSLIAGAVPTWFMGSLRMDLFSGGLGRRLIIVNSERIKVIPFPRKPLGADAAMSRVVEHLKAAEKYQGLLQLDDKAKKWWEPWYRKHRDHVSEDPILFQFDQTKAMQVLKIASLLRMTEAPLGNNVTAEHLQAAEMLLNNLVPTILKLTSGIGENKLAGVGARILDFIYANGGMVGEKTMLKHFGRYLRDPEFFELIEHYKKTEQIVVGQEPTTGKSFFFTPDGFKEYEKKRVEQLKAKTSPQAEPPSQAASDSSPKGQL